MLLRGEVLPAPRSVDQPAHVSWVRWAEERIDAGHSPLDGWYPNLSLGAPQFHQYQTLPHIVGGVLATLVGADAVIRLSMFILLVTWPVSVFLGLQLIGLDRRTAAFGALLAPLLSSASQFGYEWGAYVFRGFGLWTQLVGMWLLPVTFGLVARAVQGQGRLAIAAGVLAALVCSHFLAGSFAVVWLLVVVAVGAGRLVERMLRGALVVVGGFAIASWLLVPLFGDLRFVGQDHYYATAQRDSYGASTVLRWLASGRILDEGHTRLPVLTLLAAVGLVVCIARVRRDAVARIAVTLFLASVVLYSGRPTFGWLLDRVPGVRDLTLFRFVALTQFACLLLAALGAAFLAEFVPQLLTARTRLSPHVASALVAAAGLALVVPAAVERIDFARVDAHAIRTQRSARKQARDVASLIRLAESRGGGRIFGGTPFDFGRDFRAGIVPVYEVIVSTSAPQVGFLGRVGSLSGDVEGLFNPGKPGFAELFGVRYVLWPRDASLPLPSAIRLGTRGRYALWQIGTGGYVHVYDSVGPAIAADRWTVLPATKPYLASSDPAHFVTRPIAFDGGAAAAPTATRAMLTGAPGTTVAESDHPLDGRFTATVTTNRRAVAVLSSSYHGRWHATVDGKPARTQMVAPSLVGVAVGPGTHRVVFEYEPVAGGEYLALFGLGLVAVIALAAVDRRTARQPRTLRE